VLFEVYMNKIKIVITSVFLAILCSHIKSGVELEKETEMRYLPIDKGITTDILQKADFPEHFVRCTF